MNLLKENKKRFVLFPIKYPSLFKMYKDHVASFWTVEEIDLGADESDWNTLTESEQDFILHILGFFAASDGVVIENLVENFCSEVQIPEARAFYGFQTAIENIHSETYSLMIDKFGGDKKESLFDAIINHPSTKRKADWALKYIQKDPSVDTVTCFTKRLIAFACVEGIMFSSSFCALFWLKNRGKCPGLTFSNELISRDEGLHRDFAIELYKLCPRLERNVVVKIVNDAVRVECMFVDEILPEKLQGLNADTMKQYVKFVADHLLHSMGYEKEYKVSNPYSFMDMISLEGKTNFFEKRVGEYAKANVGNETEVFNTEVAF